MTTVKVSPKIVLKGLCAKELLKMYNDGFFTRDITPKAKIPIPNSNILAPTYGQSNKDPIYVTKDRNDSNIVIASSGHRDYEIYRTNGGEIPTGGRCMYCNYDFDHKAVGCPLKYHEKIILIEKDNKPVYKTIYIFWVEGTYCCFECVLAYIRLYLHVPSEQKDPNIRNAEQYLKFMYRLVYQTDNVLVPAKDVSLLISNGGSLTREEWMDNKHTYIRTNGVLLMPLKVEYVRQILNSNEKIISLDPVKDVVNPVNTYT